jgi:hypothetical protein
MRQIALFARAVVALITTISLGGLIGGTELLDRQDIRGFLVGAGRLAMKPSLFGLFEYDRLLLLAVCSLGVVMTWEALRNRDRPISVLASEMRVEFLDHTGADVQVSRTQYLRANQPDVTAYYMEASTSFGGTIPRDRITHGAFVGRRAIRDHVDIPPTSGDTRLEIAHVFDDAMPFGLVNVLVPEFLLRFLVARIRIQPRFVVRREIAIHYVNEHGKNDTYYQATADRYVQRNVKVSVKFHPGRLPRIQKGVLEAQLIRRNGIERIYSSVRGDATYEYGFRRLKNERVRIPFRF